MPTRRRLLAAAGTLSLSTLAGCARSGSETPDRTPYDVPPRSSDDAVEVDLERTETRPPIPESGRAGPATDCPADAVAFDPPWVVAGDGPLGGFILIVDKPTVGVGETLTCELRNVSRGGRSTTTRRALDVQRRASDGWRTVFGVRGEPGHPQELVDHRPGEGFTWRFPFSRRGLASLSAPVQSTTDRGRPVSGTAPSGGRDGATQPEGTETTRADDSGEGQGSYAVCGPVEPGEYRLVYWGITPQSQREREDVEYALGAAFRVE